MEIETARNSNRVEESLAAFAYVQRWIPGMADIAKPLYEVLEKNGRQKWKKHLLN